MYSYVVEISHLAKNEPFIEQCTDNNFSVELLDLLNDNVKQMLCHLLMTMRAAGYTLDDGALNDSLHRIHSRRQLSHILDMNQKAFDVLGAFTADFLPFIVSFLQ